MRSARYLDCLRADAALLRAAAAADLTAAVPSCPGWTATDLVNHVATVYLHKAETIRQGAWPSPWPPDLSGEEPLAVLDRFLADLLGELTAHDPGTKALTWYDPDQSVGFWIRRMAHETVIHRVDAELARGAGVSGIPDDLAVDGIDEVLVTFLAFASTGWPEDFGDALPALSGRAIALSAGDRHWVVRPAATGAEVTSAAGPADVTITGSPQDLLLWLWRRGPADGLRVEGDAALAEGLYGLMRDATQ
ncbi:maleylpyruvate isomerase family mycothiol-dependent enzyme [Nonomuraea sediminis]|uniref:maleylpyruvate isomerase family mycothiol-dependent enzyme n=1 Tax=Nonomuraea sediminis TaxID=2835864 RepID=UPI001BDC83EE|nr:maleylpyruvate isomerase family mycothiol-dependent enzyme [Nonomuraea sediminis]